MSQCHVVSRQIVVEETEEVNQKLCRIYEWKDITFAHFEPHVEESDRAIQQYFIAKEILTQQEEQVYQDWRLKHLGHECVLLTRVDLLLAEVVEKGKRLHESILLVSELLGPSN